MDINFIEWVNFEWHSLNIVDKFGIVVFWRVYEKLYRLKSIIQAVEF